MVKQLEHGHGHSPPNDAEKISSPFSGQLSTRCLGKGAVYNYQSEVTFLDFQTLGLELQLTLLFGDRTGKHVSYVSEKLLLSASFISTTYRGGAGVAEKGSGGRGVYTKRSARALPSTTV